MDFVFMLTRADQTVPDALDVLEDIRTVGLQHIGFKDVGGTPELLGRTARRIRELGATSYMEIVNPTRDGCLAAARLAREIGIDRLLGGTAVDEVLEILAGSNTQYLPFPGKPFGHPTKLAGSPADVEADCRRYRATGCPGVDLLAHRATEADPLDLVRAARRGLDGGFLLVAGGVRTPAQIRELAALGVDAFTIGTAIFDGSFAPNLGSQRSQLKAALDACR